mmetsp:Transcript_21068/g.30430  ORF Transcript_21068/g.30430 Transcript_21068/m.30430 type:complete len:725 (+) Transcript_21068:68-2242(+)|eukprot:CAMPEP_0185017586 /NCGR_PEP_ID=MMETSP1103-20130426/518_1 /TAXON_ID=36769 /ORGANISM="Paraphysomonas bandaiensis, Strain Caron Lab Isolate" /LENGTH=724 /DNA_ID=CAMNT_0027547065 /DNA_START=16 /DNA_END=2190 /DNA_ORIENTATION=+
MTDVTFSRRIENLSSVLDDISSSPVLAKERAAAYRRFAGIAGLEIPEESETTEAVHETWEDLDNEGTIDVFAFRADMIQRGYDSHWADATFKAFDIKKDGEINKCEYFLGVLMATESDKLAAFNDKKWNDFRCKMLFSFYCNASGVMGAADFARCVKDLTSINRQVEKIINEVGAVDSSWMCNRDEFIELVSSGNIDVFSHENISRMHKPPKKPTHRVTLDDRLITTDNCSPNLDTHVSTTIPLEGKAPGLVVHADLLPTYHWPQTILYDRNNAAYKIASFVMQQVIGLVYLQLPAEKMDEPHDLWIQKRVVLSTLLGTTERERQFQYVQQLCEAAKKIFTAQPTVVNVDAPCKVFGDIHGQFRDMLLLFSRYGFPSHRGGDIELSSYVFNGDWVDRGPHQLETVLFLFSIKILYPTRVYLVRGNHEFKQQNKNMSRCGAVGFDKACWSAFKGMLGNVAYRHVHKAFDMLPLVAVVDNSIAVMHGGLGDGSWTLDDIRALKRPISSELSSEIVFNVVWSDPIPELPMDARKGAHTSERDNFRGLIKRFAMDITEKWCARENLSLIIRSHEYNPSGFLVMHGGRLITVFSARNYMDTQLNDSALLLLAYDDTHSLRVKIKTLSKKSTPNSSQPISAQFGTVGSGTSLLDAIQIQPLSDIERENSFDSIISKVESDTSDADLKLPESGVDSANDQVESDQDKKKNSTFVKSLRRSVKDFKIFGNKK